MRARARPSRATATTLVNLIPGVTDPESATAIFYDAIASARHFCCFPVPTFVFSVYRRVRPPVTECAHNVPTRVDDNNNITTTLQQYTHRTVYITRVLDSAPTVVSSTRERTTTFRGVLFS